MTQNYRTNQLLLSVLIWLCIGCKANADIQPFNAHYDLHINGYYIGEVTQQLRRDGDYWVIQQTTEAKGFASLFQNNPIIEKQSFKVIGNQLHLISFQFNDDETHSSAFYQKNISQLQINHNGKTQRLKLKQPIYSYLLLAIKANLANDKKKLTIYDQGTINKVSAPHISQSILKDGSHTFNTTIVEFDELGSNKKLRYTFLKKQPNVAFKIERLTNNKTDMELRLKNVK